MTSLPVISLATIPICGDFDIHQKEWLVHSNITDEEWKYCHDFSSTFYELCQVVGKPIRVPDTTGHHANVLDLFFTYCPDQYSVEVLPPVNTSDHSLISAKVDAKPDTRRCAIS